MVKHQRAVPLIRLLARLGWQREPDLWTVRCRDGRGRRARLSVHVTATGITLDPSLPGPWVLQPMEAGRLRAAIRDALLSADQLAGFGDGRNPPRTLSTPPPAPAGVPGPRQRIRVDLLTRPSVADIASRIAATTTPDPEVNHADPGGVWWTFLTEPATASRPEVPAELHTSKVHLTPRGAYVIIPNLIDGGGSSRWIEAPRPRHPLQPWSVVIGATRRVVDHWRQPAATNHSPVLPDSRRPSGGSR